MAKIVLEVDNKNKDTVLMILKNLKSNLIKNISVENKRASQAILEDEFLSTPSSNSKYLSKNAYKAKIAKR